MGERCVWSNEYDEGTRMVVLQVRGRPAADEVVNVCPAHEAKVRRIHRRAERYGNVLFASFGVSVIVMVGSTLAGIGVGMGMGVIFFGTAILILPFPTPQTVGALGMRRAVWVARGIGVLIIALGIDALFEIL